MTLGRYSDPNSRWQLPQCEFCLAAITRVPDSGSCWEDRLKLVSAGVNYYRSVEDSGGFAVEPDATCLVGRRDCMLAVP